MRVLYTGIVIVLLAAACRTEERVPAQEQMQPAETPEPAARGEQQQTTVESSKAEPVADRATLVAPGVGMCQPESQVESMVSQLVEHADTNGDGKIARKEGESLMNFLVGGFFFRADENGDGQVTPEEGREARQEFAQQNPAFAALLQQANALKQATGQRPFVRIAEMMDIEYDKPLSAQDVRSAARSALDDVFRVVDRDKNGTITQVEVRNASVSGAKALGHQAFAAADANNNGSLDMNELKSSVTAVISPVFGAADENGDGKLTEQEASVALSQLAAQVGMPLSSKKAPQP